MRKLWLGSLAFFVAILILGIVCGDAEQVFHKAIKICLECIGIG